MYIVTTGLNVLINKRYIRSTNVRPFDCSQFIRMKCFLSDISHSSTAHFHGCY